MEKHPLHLKNPELQTSPEVQRAVERQERQTGEKIPNDPTARIEAYTDRLENIFLNPDEHIRERNIDAFRGKIYDDLIIKRENFPESYFELQQRVARERGQAVETISADVREQMMAVAIEDQKASLDSWIDYLSSADAVYPAWFKYFAWKNITKLSQFDKERGEFKKRGATTVAPYPDIYREPLAQICDLYIQVKEDNKTLRDPEVQALFTKKFPILYAELISKSLAASMENREEIKGEWIKYEQGRNGDAEKLYQSLQGKGTGWCTAGQSTAEAQIKSGDFYVYYTNDTTGEPTQPRLAIRMDGNGKIGEVRGVLAHQSVEPQLQDILDEKLQTFGPEADRYRKTSADMKRLTDMEDRLERGKPWSRDDIIFLYEIDVPIEGFGYGRDPRVKELREIRNPEEDMLIIFDCTKEQIAHNTTEINENTKAYLGEWSVDVYQTIKNHPNIKHLYESFPDQKIFMQTLETDPRINSSAKAEEALKAKNIWLSDYGKDILYKTEFSHEGKTYELVQFTVNQLGFRGNNTTTDQIYAKAQELGLELCPAEVGPQLRLAYGGTDYKVIAMKQITDRDGRPDVFRLSAGGAELELDGYFAYPGYRWDGGLRFVFCSRKIDS